MSHSVKNDYKIILKCSWGSGDAVSSAVDRWWSPGEKPQENNGGQIEQTNYLECKSEANLFWYDFKNMKTEFETQLQDWVFCAV